MSVYCLTVCLNAVSPAWTLIIIYGINICIFKIDQYTETCTHAHIHTQTGRFMTLYQKHFEWGRICWVKSIDHHWTSLISFFKFDNDQWSIWMIRSMNWGSQVYSQKLIEFIFLYKSQQTRDFYISRTHEPPCVRVCIIYIIAHRLSK